MFNWKWVSCLVGLIIFSMPTIGISELLIDPGSGGTTLTIGNSALSSPFEDDVIVQINTANTFMGKFYGNSVGTITVSDNGNLNFSNSLDYFPYGFTDTTALTYAARIAPLFDDVLMYSELPGNRIVDHSVPGSYLAITWQNVMLFNDSWIDPPPRQSFQALWFEAPTNIRGFQFQADDIAFGYQGGGVNGSEFGAIEGTVGITNGAGLFTPIPGDTPVVGHPEGDGFIDYFSGQTNLLAWEPNTFLLFRPKADPSLGYTSAKLQFTPVPEPNTAAVASAAMMSLLVFRRSKHRRKRKITCRSQRVCVDRNRKS